MLVSFARIAQDTGSLSFAQLKENLLDAALDRPLWETRLGWNLMYFVAALLAVHLALAAVAWMLGRLSAVHWSRVESSAAKWTAMWSLMLAAWILTANATWYPNSSLGGPYAAAMSADWHGIRALHVVTALVLLAVAALLGKAVIASIGGALRRPAAAVAAGVALVAGTTLLIVEAQASARSPHVQTRPHIIIIGIDSLRCDMVRRGAATLTPGIDEFLAGSTQFTDAMTPLARTFGSWVSIISGRHPHTTGALVNLLPRDLIRPGDTLPMMAGRAGYRTVYAIDEVRFSNLDASFGFDRTITPPMGASDFILGFFADTPLTNLVVNTWLGEYLFPYAHGNRAAFATYDPDTLVHRLERGLEFDQPTLLALHLTLVHWPYIWAQTPPSPATGSNGAGALIGPYEAAAHRVDRQFSDIMALLERRGALDNALVVVLSDHGEALGAPGDSLVPASGVPGLALAESAGVGGHGTSVLSPHQYRVVLGMRAYGNSLQSVLAGRKVSAPVSLEDLAPTIAELFSLKPHDRFDGRSLVPLLFARPGAESEFEGRIRFTESEFNPPGMSMANPMANTHALAEATRYYEVDPVTDRVEIRRDKLDMIMANRQYAAIEGNTLLAAVPGQLSPGEHFLVVDLRGGLPRRLMSTPDRRRDPRVADLWDALHSRFRDRLAPGSESSLR